MWEWFKVDTVCGWIHQGCYEIELGGKCNFWMIWVVLKAESGKKVGIGQGKWCLGIGVLKVKF